MAPLTANGQGGVGWHSRIDLASDDEAIAFAGMLAADHEHLPVLGPQMMWRAKCLSEWFFEKLNRSQAVKTGRNRAEPKHCGHTNRRLNAPCQREDCRPALR